MKTFYVVTRDLHLYLGLFISPFIVVFALSVFWLVHPPAPETVAPVVRTVNDVAIPENLETLTGRAQADALQTVLDAIGVRGEINFVRRNAKEHRMMVPVMVPGRDTQVDLDLTSRTATISERTTGFGAAVVHLHKMPGPHNVAVRGNSFYIRVWRVLADVTVWITLFLSVSGIYLWAVLRAERRAGLIFLAVGALSCFGAVYGLIR